jgi:hypothetical protein
MTVKIISILLTFFIFVMVNQAGAGDVKSMKNTPNQGTTMKMDDNRVSVLRRTEPTKESATSLKELNARFQSAISYSATNHGTIIGSSTKLRVNFLKVLKEKKKLQWTDSLHRVISSYEFFQHPWRDRFLSSRETNETNSPDSNFGQSVPKLYLNPEGDKYFEEGKIQSTLKLLQSKREEMFNEVFVGFRFSFGQKNTHSLPEVKISPSFEKGAGFTIAF